MATQKEVLMTRFLTTTRLPAGVGYLFRAGRDHQHVDDIGDVSGGDFRLHHVELSRFARPQSSAHQHSDYVQMTIISSLVIVVDQVLQAVAYDISKSLSVLLV